MSKNKSKHKKRGVERKKAKPRKMDISFKKALRITGQEYEATFRKLADSE